MKDESILFELARTGLQAGWFVVSVVLVTAVVTAWCVAVLLLTGRLPWAVRRYL